MLTRVPKSIRFAICKNGEAPRCQLDHRAMLQYIEGEPHFTILDFDCGPGRDLKVAAELGHIAVRLEGAAHSAEMARALQRQRSLVAGILKLDLPDNYFDGVFADAACFMYPARSCGTCCWTCTQV
jgi:SAM-dependent methyltransferase